MVSTAINIGIIGGSGMLGSAIATAILASGNIAPAQVWISNTSGQAPGFALNSSVHITKDNGTLVDACDMVILCVPPAAFPEIHIHAPDKLVMSVMAGVTLDQLGARTGAVRLVRAMSSPAASLALAYSPWIASPEVTSSDRHIVQIILEACGKTDEVFDESQLDHFTAMTGPVPGFVALFAQSMADHAERQGIAPEVADRAVRQLFLAAGTMMAAGAARPADHVREMIDYAGTTAAGLTAMLEADLPKSISDGLLAAADKAKSF
ncbi:MULTISPECIES: pyrroline-5-carboxylate reductase family protein [Roseobacteraceae]|uniref:Pyrroline-5-carboxylate reductase n=1 Tax=Pseudosulfitobacter pseudonitzschiae TaxID=1402135 RepID=A0A221K598_9RHOB|nr:MULTISPECIES: pyrroline-5-carboxylate reductase dimerization domain-containing protein [Roseobacteraceae]ASM74169.1 pyrroline-5-carboxylate reductase [Pseudosulfitobacter pseudonitzschiae]